MLVGERGFEPLASASISPSSCTTRCPIGALILTCGAERFCGFSKPLTINEKIGAPDRIRTCDLRLRRAALYPAELRVRRAGLEPWAENAGTLRQSGRARKRSGPSPPPPGNHHSQQKGARHSMDQRKSEGPPRFARGPPGPDRLGRGCAIQRSAPTNPGPASGWKERHR